MKFALKLPQLNRSWLMLGGALALGIVAAILSQKMLKEEQERLRSKFLHDSKEVFAVVARQDMPRGARVQPALFQRRKVPSEFLHSSAITPENFGQYIGQKLGAPLKHGEPLLNVHLESTAAVFSSTLESGNRALTTEVDEVNSISRMLRPSDHIDLMATARHTGLNGTEVTFPLLSNVEVLATGQVTRKRDGTNQPHTYTTITLSVSPQDAERIIVAKSSGKLTAVLRNPDDVLPNTTSAMNIDDVLPKKSDAAKHHSVDYIIGGRS